MKAKQTIDADLFKRAVLLTIINHGWRNKRNGNMAKVTTEANKNLVRITKKLVESPEYDAVMKFEKDTRDWCEERSMPSFMHKGMYLVSNEIVEEMDSRLEKANDDLRENLVPAFISKYPGCKEQAKGSDKLADLYNEADYPKPGDLADSFYIEWKWVALDVPSNLPKEVREKEVAKMKQAIADAQVEIVRALREGFGEVVERMIDRLNKKADGDKTRFDDSLIDAFNDFFNTFDARNLMRDDELAVVVNNAKSILKGVRPKGLKDNETLRNRVQKQMETVKVAVNELIKDAPARRKMDFTEED